MNVRLATANVVQRKCGGAHGPASFFDRQAQHTDSTQNPRKQLVYDPPAFVVRHVVTAALRSMDEARMKATPGRSKEALKAEC